MKAKLTKTSLAGLTLPKGTKEAIIWDEAVPAFGVRLRRKGEKDISRTFIVQFTVGSRTDGRPRLTKRLSLGTAHPAGLEKARELALDTLARARLGQDPAGEKKIAHERAHETFGKVAERFCAVQKGRLRSRSYADIERHLLTAAKPLHALRLDAVDRRTIAGLLAGFIKKPYARNRLRASLSTFFTWAMREGLAEFNPVIATNKADEAARDRVLMQTQADGRADYGELIEVWRALADDEYGTIIKLLILTGQRREEIGGLCWSEIDLDNERIVLPPERTKNGREHVIPLAPAALDLLTKHGRREEGGEPRDLVFGRGKGGYSGWSKSKERLDSRIHEKRRERDPEADPMKWRVHDLRRTATTAMNSLGVQPHVVEAVINHISGHKAGVAGIYNRASYEREKRQALTLWAEHVTALVEDRRASIVPFVTSERKVPA